MTDDNTILAKIDAALQDDDTPRWAVPMLLCIRDDHVKLDDHLRKHTQRSESVWGPARQIAVSVVTALVVVLALWFLAGRFPQVFMP